MAKSDQHQDRPLVLDGSPLTFSDVVTVARGGCSVQIAQSVRDSLERSRQRLETVMADGDPHYGINTGFGSLARQRVPDADLRALQVNLVRSHAACVGDPLPDDVVRAMLLLLAASLSRNRSGVRPVVVERIVGLLNAGVTPVVPEVGSVGASGDLAPLAHASLVLLGEGEATIGSKTMSGALALKEANLEPLQLQAKEGLALLNGTHLMAARGALLIEDFDRLFDAAILAAAMSIDACRGTDSFLDPRVYEARNQPGPASVAGKLRAALCNSQIIPSHREDDDRVQDPYSLRCVAVVLGAAADAAAYVRSAVQHELGAVTDNPLVFDDGSIISAGNFHGMPLAIPLDTLTMSIAHIAGIAERRVYYMLAARDPETNLNPHLSKSPGTQSGLMITQYTAAACCNEIIGLATPASVANIPTSAGTEDYNSFGPRSAAKADRAMTLARHVVAIELLCATQGLEYHRPLKSGDVVEKAHQIVRSRVPALEKDRPPSPDIEAIASMIHDGAFDGLIE